jgi:hypothetical protein
VRQCVAGVEPDGGTLDYHLGDVSDGVTPGQGDNSVSTADLSLLGAHYGQSGGALTGFEYLDVGPTTDNTTNGRPTTDSKVQFEDLVLFAINYTPAVSLVAVKTGPAFSSNALSVSMPATVARGDVFDVTVTLSGAGDVQALSIALGWDARTVQPAGVEAGELITAQNGVVLSPGAGCADAALLGAGRGITGQGTVAVIHFRAVGDGAPGVQITHALGRNASNQDVAISIQAPVSIDAVVAATDLMPVIPNPVRDRATLNYSIARRGNVDLSIYSVDGRRVKTLAHGVQEVGRYHFNWDGTDERGATLSSGVYYVRFQSADVNKTRLVTLVR